MNRAPVLFLGAFLALAFSWTGIVLVNQVSYGRLAPVYDVDDAKIMPEQAPGDAARGKLVYQDLGCIYCHTQQVRREGYGTDTLRGWGRMSVARDYINESRVLLGTMRTGPDLRNVGARLSGQGGREWHIKHLYNPQFTSPGSIMPPFSFLFETRKIVGERDPNAVDHVLGDNVKVPAGCEVVLTQRGQDLIAYLLSLKSDYEGYPELKNVYVAPAPAKEEGKK